MKNTTMFLPVVISHLFLSLTPAQATVTLDPAFAPRFELSGSAIALAVQPNNKTVVIGNFTSVNGQGRQNIARLNADGTTDTSFQLEASQVVTWRFFAVGLQLDGKILVGGDLFFVLPGGNDLRQFLARLNADGSIDATFDAGTYATGGLDGTVKAIAVEANGRIVIGGSFSSIHGVARNRLARLNPDGSVDAAFNPGTGANGDILAITIQTDGKILIGGDFTQINGTNRNRICRLNADGSLDPGFDAGEGANGTVRAIAIQPNGQIGIGGDFSSVRGVPTAKVARLFADGRVDSTFSRAEYFYAVNTVAALDDNSLVVGGWNGGIIFGGYPMDHDAYLISYGAAGAAQYAQYFKGKPTEVTCLARRPDGNVICGGTFHSLDVFSGEPAVYRHGLCVVNNWLQVDNSFKPVLGSVGQINALQRQTDGKVLAVGNFNLVNGQVQSNVARINLDGSRDSSYQPPYLGRDPLSTAVLQKDGRLVVAGASLAVRLNLDGSLDSTWTNSLRTYVNALAPQADGKIIAAGKSYAVQSGIVRLETNGQLDSTFEVGDGLPSTQLPHGGYSSISSVAITDNGQLLLGGTFEEFNGIRRTNMVRLNSNGGVDLAFSPPVFSTGGTFGSASVSCLLVQSNGQILVGGHFMTVDGIPSPCVARLNPSGDLDARFISGLETWGGTVSSLAQQSNGRLFVGGSFQVNRSNMLSWSLARLNDNGTFDAGFITAASGSGDSTPALSSLLLTPDNQLLAGGYFTGFDGSSRSSAARFIISPDDTLPPLKLSLWRMASQRVVIAWPETATNFTLEENSGRLASPTNWQPSAIVPAILNHQFVVTNPALLPARFYRLKSK